MRVGQRVRLVRLATTDKWMREHVVPLIGGEGTVVGLSETAAMSVLVELDGGPRPLYFRENEIEEVT